MNYLLSDSIDNIKANRDSIFYYIYDNLSGYRIIEDIILELNVFTKIEWLDFVGGEMALETAFAKRDDKDLYKVNI